MDIIRIELEDKIYRIKKPQTFEELKTKLNSKFHGRNPIDNYCLAYKYIENQLVFVKNEDDYRLAFLQKPNEELHFKFVDDLEYLTDKKDLFKLKDVIKLHSQILKNLGRISTSRDDQNSSQNIQNSRSFFADSRDCESDDSNFKKVNINKDKTS